MIGAGPFVFVDDLQALALDDGDRHHLQRVLRVRAGEPVSVSDGRGSVLPCRLTAAGELVADGEPGFRPRSQPPVTIAFAPVKGDRPEWAVQKLTELGADRIVALSCERSVVRWDGERAASHLDRWRRVAREAAMQSRRAWLPDIDDHPRPPAALVEPGAGTPIRAGATPAVPEPGSGGVVRADRGAPALAPGVHTVLVGPEGGWSPAERALLPAAGLGPTVLRTETAAVAAAVLVCAFRDGRVGRGARSFPGF